MRMQSLLEAIAGAVSRRSRMRKWGQFLALMTPDPDDRLIDVGVNTTEYSESDNFLERHYAHPEKITAVAVGYDLAEFKNRYPLVTALTSDGTRLPFADDHFDIAYSNAVVEHVGGHDKQVAFLRELYRVGKRGYLTTPNRYFPVEVHTRIPLLHIVLSKRTFDRIATRLGKGWAAGDYMNLLSAGDIRRLASEAGFDKYRLLSNRFCGFIMTFTIVWTKKGQPSRTVT